MSALRSHKVVLVGDCGVGKTSLVNSLLISILKMKQVQ